MTRDEREPTPREGSMAETRVEFYVQAHTAREGRRAWGNCCIRRTLKDARLAIRSYRSADTRRVTYRIVRRTITEEVVE